MTGLPISYSNTIIGLYSRYGIALARVNRCSEAFAISTMMKQTVADDEIGMINAEEMIKICQENLTNPLPKSLRLPPQFKPAFAYPASDSYTATADQLGKYVYRGTQRSFQKGGSTLRTLLGFAALAVDRWFRGCVAGPMGRVRFGLPSCLPLLLPAR